MSKPSAPCGLFHVGLAMPAVVCNPLSCADPTTTLAVASGLISILKNNPVCSPPEFRDVHAPPPFVDLSMPPSLPQNTMEGVGLGCGTNAHACVSACGAFTDEKLLPEFVDFDWPTVPK